jgi:D-glycero-D-manno-heptose 1,7-bisphosphate phosphatase
MTKTPALLLDRDGVIIEDLHYVANIDQVRVIDGAVAAIRQANAAGIPVVIVTNQSGVARGYMSEETVDNIHAYLKEWFEARGALIHKFYYCPHHPDHGSSRYRMQCACRKPEPGMLLRAGHELNLDLQRSWMIGDKLSDLRAGASAGCETVLVRTGYGDKVRHSLPAEELKLVGVASDVEEAVNWFMEARQCASRS